MTGWRVTICRSLVQIIGTGLSLVQQPRNIVLTISPTCRDGVSIAPFLATYPPIPSLTLHQNLARSAAVASKPYKMLTGTLCTSKQILTNSESIFLSLNVLADFQFNSPNLQVTCFYIELMEVKSLRCSGLRGAYNKW